MLEFLPGLFNSEIWDLGAYCRAKQVEYQERGMHMRRNCVPSVDGSPAAKRPKLSDDIIQTNIAFFRAHYKDTALPKSLLHVYANKHNLLMPKYETQQEDRLFRSIMSFDNRRFASSYWEKNKRFAEQGSALVALLHLGMVEEDVLIKNGSILK